jgi:hypothetical protein
MEIVRWVRVGRRGDDKRRPTETLYHGMESGSSPSQEGKLKMRWVLRLARWGRQKG